MSKSKTNLNINSNYYCLSIVATPIGNLKEITELAKETLSNCSTIFCEDTRVTSKLLHLLQLQHGQKLISYNKFKEEEKLNTILYYLTLGPCALVSDAGYPLIADPGSILIQHLRSINAPIKVINGPCALIHALVGSGIDLKKFFWASFLNKKLHKRSNELLELKEISQLATIIYYEPTNFLKTGLQLIEEVFGSIHICVARELSKLHETFYYGTPLELVDIIPEKGEFVVIIPQQKIIESDSLNELMEQMHQLITLHGMNIKAAAKVIKNTEYTASFLYKKYLTNYHDTKKK